MASKKKTEKAPEVKEQAVLNQDEETEALAQAEQSLLDDGYSIEEDITEEEKIEVKKTRKMQIDDLIEMGRQKGKLTTQEILDALEGVDLDPEQMDKMYETLESNNIEICWKDWILLRRYRQTDWKILR